MKSLGCVGAMNLDAGASTAMYYEANRWRRRAAA